MKGPYTQMRDELTAKYMETSAAILRIMDALPMTTEEKVLYLAQTMAQIEMYVTGTGTLTVVQTP